MAQRRQASSRTHFSGSLAVVVLIALLVNSALTLLPDTCSSDNDCDRGYCCRLSMVRYSYPRCQPLLTGGERCRKPSEETHNITLGYPNGDVLQLKGVHLVMCPCGEGLRCDEVCVKR